MKKDILFNLDLSGNFILESSAIKNGYIEDRYGKYGDQKIKKMPSCSLPLNWKGAPKNTECFALVMEDYESFPVAGFCWIHWVAIIPNTLKELKENASIENKKLIQGVNSWISSRGGLEKEEAIGYGGPTPPNSDHTYTIKMYALDKKLSLQNGFFLSDLYSEIENHILDIAILKGKYRK